MASSKFLRPLAINVNNNGIKFLRDPLHQRQLQTCGGVYTESVQGKHRAPRQVVSLRGQKTHQHGQFSQDISRWTLSRVYGVDEGGGDECVLSTAALDGDSEAISGRDQAHRR